MITKTFLETDRGPLARVTFTLPNGFWANEVYLVGDFNNWNTSSHPFRHDHEGKWVITVDLEINRTYEFRYWCDGEWTNDRQADGYVHNTFGSDNFVVNTDPHFGHQHAQVG